MDTNAKIQFIRVGNTLVDTVRGEAFQTFHAVRSGSATLRVEDILALTAKAVWDAEQQCWGIIQPIRWNPSTGAGPMKLRHVREAVEVELPA